MNTKGEPFAFPSQIGFGMTLRDYFAGQALSGRMANSEGSDAMIGKDSNGIAEILAIEAYTVADAMLAERAK